MRLGWLRTLRLGLSDARKRVLRRQQGLAEEARAQAGQACRAGPLCNPLRRRGDRMRERILHIIDKPAAVIVDMDGTLSDATHRLRFIKEKPKDWEKFFDLCG